MSHHSHAPLLMLCAASALVLNVYTSLDPRGVYETYLEKRGALAPPIAAMADAVADGVFPWSIPPREEAIPAPDPGPTPGSSATPEDSGTAVPEEEGTLTPEDGAPAPSSPFTTVDASYFDDALFLGDSHTDGFRSYADLPNASYLCHNGLTVWSATEKRFSTDSGKMTLAEALSQKQYGKLYVLLGINELGTGSAESWAAQYQVLLDELRALQPDAIIFLQAIFHTTQEKSDTTFYKNSTIDARNAALQALADNEHVFYLDCNPVFDDETGALRADYSGDGVHVKAAYYTLWRDHLFQFGVLPDAAPTES